MSSTCVLWPIRNCGGRGGTINRIRIAHSPLAAANICQTFSWFISKIRAVIDLLCPLDVRRNNSRIKYDAFLFNILMFVQKSRKHLFFSFWICIYLRLFLFNLSEMYNTAHYSDLKNTCELNIHWVIVLNIEYWLISGQNNAERIFLWFLSPSGGFFYSSF